MVNSVKHKKISTAPDDGDTSLIQASDWNDDHEIVVDYADGNNIGVLPISKGGTGSTTPEAARSAIGAAASSDLSGYVALSQKGAADGVAPLGSDGIIPSIYLPSYVDDVLEYANLASFPAVGEASKIYIALDTNRTYRWSGSAYIWISEEVGTADTAVKLATPRTISAVGDGTWSVIFDGSSNVSASFTLGNSGVTAGTYRSVTVDSKGRVTAGANPTTLSGYGITDAQPLDATLTAVAGAAPVANSFIYFTATDAAAVGSITAFGRSIIDDPDAATARATLGLGTAATQNSTAFQAADGDLTAIASLSGTSGLLRKTADNTWSLDTAGYLTGNQTITFTGDATGSGSTSVGLTLANSGVTANSYGSSIAVATFSVDTKGRITTAASTTIRSATTGQTGVVQLSTATNSTSTTLAATPSAVKSAYDLAAAAIPATQKGAANGVAPLGADSLIPSAYLPSFVDDVLEFATLSAFPVTGEQAKIYVALDTNRQYRWSGSVYIWINESSGTADSAVKLATARTFTIGGTARSFDGTANVSWSLADIGAQAALGFTPVQQGGGALQGSNKIYFGWGTDGSQLRLQVDSTDFGNTLPISIAKNAGTATKLQTSRSISATGDGTWSVSFDGSANVSGAFALAATGVTAGTYKSVTVDAKGRVTSGTNPTTLAGYGITDAVSKSDVITNRINSSGGTPSQDWAGASIQVREAGLVTNTNLGNEYAPCLSFHWGSVVAAQLRMRSDGNIYVLGQTTTGNDYRAIYVSSIRFGTTGISISATDYGGNSATSTKLKTARTINGVPFDGTANITVTASGSTVVIDAVEPFTLNELNLITVAGTFSLPSTTGLAVGVKLFLAKTAGLTPVIQVNGGNSEKIIIGKTPADYQEYDSFSYNINTGITLMFNGSDWELL